MPTRVTVLLYSHTHQITHTGTTIKTRTSTKKLQLATLTYSLRNVERRNCYLRGVAVPAVAI